jgi:hypothetical protein
MKPWIRLLARSAVVLAAVAIVFLPTAPVRAGTGGNEDIYGDVGTYRIYYFRERYINIPSSSGPDIAALKYAGPTGMKLGAHNCVGGVLTGSPQIINTSYYVGLVPDQSTYHNQKF